MKELGVLSSVATAGRGSALARDAVAGCVGAVVLIANIVSFAALMFPGTLAHGASTAIWAMLIGSGVTGIWVAWKTSLPPLATGIDSPTGAVLVLLAASAGPAMLAAGDSPQAAIQTTLLLFSAATLLSAALLFGLGAGRWGSFLRFVPYFVVAGFLAATGWLLIAGGVRMTTGRGLGGLFSDWTTVEAAKLACAVLAFGLLLALRKWVRSTLALPAALLGMTVAGAVALRMLGLAESRHGWYLASLGSLTPWSPLEALQSMPLTLSMAIGFLPELMAVTIVALVSLVAKISSLEVARKASGDLDLELRIHGAGTLAAVAFGGIASTMQLGTSRLLENAGGATRASGVVCALVLALVGLSSFDLPSLIPLPIAAGLVFYLGYGFLVEALAKPLAQHAWLNLLLALTIMAACVRYGYLVGVISGIIGACLLFAVSYARIGVVRQHLSRAQFSGNVSRSTEATRHLSEVGAAIQIYWLSGYIFFGSSEGVFERVRKDLRMQPAQPVRHVILDFGRVSGADASATVSLAKLRNFCGQQGATLVFSSLADDIQRLLERDGLFDGTGQQPAFAEVNGALAWCEDRLLDQARHEPADSTANAAGFEAWLQQQLGAEVRAADFMTYLRRRVVADSQVLYRQGEPADDIDLVAAGTLVVDITTDAGLTLRARRITTHTVVGEMGFFRRAARSATVSSEGAAILYTMTRSNFESMRRERPELASSFDDFLLRTLADRISVSERMVAALGR